MSGLRGTAAALAALLALVVLAACDAGSGQGGDTRNLIVSEGPPAMRRTLDVEQPLERARSSTSADPGRTASQLKADGFSTGFARTWTSGPEDVEVLQFALSDEFHSRDFVQFELLSLSHGAGVLVAPHPTVPDSTIFTFNGRTRARVRQVFCQGAWFVVVQYAFEVTDCSDTPRYPNVMVDVTQRQYLSAVAALGRPAELLSPSPSASPR
ncbi:MAG: hypothetical protein ABR573_03050 [Candidatus Dormibacteria bacterium]